MKKMNFSFYNAGYAFPPKASIETFCSWNELVKVRLWRIPLLIFTHKIRLSVVSLIANVTAFDMKVLHVRGVSL